MIAAVSFFSSLALLAAFFGFRFWEERRGARLFAPLRSNLDAQVGEVYRAAVMGGIPSSWRHSLVALFHSLTHRAVLSLVDILRAVERPLARLSLRLRIHKLSPNGKEVSPFLKNITPDKNGDNGTTPTSGV